MPRLQSLLLWILLAVVKEVIHRLFKCLVLLISNKGHCWGINSGKHIRQAKEFLAPVSSLNNIQSHTKILLFTEATT